jgi:nitroimidazol reductase NimA-like FMN-containing flavoprotein (pyridoxamine 5'-phosphate oxidase superfamily)
MTDHQPANLADQIARRDRAVADEVWIRDFLRRSPTCFLATIREGRPYLNANLFVYDEPAEVVYVHSSGRGQTRTNVQVSERVCLAVAEMGRLLPGPLVTDFSTEYASVVIYGRATVVTDPAEARHALQSQLDKYFPHLRPDRDYAPFTDEESARAAVYRIEIEEWSAKRNQSEAGHPGALWYPDAYFQREA